MIHPTPHGDKLRALVENRKLPESDRSGIDTAIERYEAWIAEIEANEGDGRKLIESLVASLNLQSVSQLSWFQSRELHTDLVFCIVKTIVTTANIFGPVTISDTVLDVKLVVHETKDDDANIGSHKRYCKRYDGVFPIPSKQRRKETKEKHGPREAYGSFSKLSIMRIFKRDRTVRHCLFSNAAC